MSDLLTIVREHVRRRLDDTLARLRRAGPDLEFVLSFQEEPEQPDTPTECASARERDVRESAAPILLAYAALGRRREGRPLPFRARVVDLVDQVESDVKSVVDSVASEVVWLSEELLAPGVRTKVVRRALDSWPWPVRPPSGALLHLLLAGLSDPFELRLTEWPAHAPVHDVRKWARAILEPRPQPDGQEPAVDLRRVTSWAKLDDETRVPIPVGAAMLYLASHRPEDLRVSPSSPPIDATATTVWVCKFLHDPTHEDRDAWLDVGGTKEALVVVGTDARDREHKLTIPEVGGEDAEDALDVVRREFGPTAVHDLLALFDFAWTNGGPAGGSFWWWPAEHLALAGLADNSKNRAALKKRMERLEETHLEVRYPDGGHLTGPIITRGVTNGAAVKVALHDGLYEGVSPKLGGKKWFWIVPRKVLSLGGNFSGLLAVRVCELLRVNCKRGYAEIKAEGLAKSIHLRGRANRKKDPYLSKTLAAELDKATSAGLLEWELTKGELDYPEDAVIRIYPGPESRAILDGDLPHPAPEPLPASGDDLVEWLGRSGRTVARAARDLGVGARTIRGQTKYRARPLESALRQALRHLLWGPYPSERHERG